MQPTGAALRVECGGLLGRRGPLKHHLWILSSGELSHFLRLFLSSRYMELLFLFLLFLFFFFFSFSSGVTSLTTFNHLQPPSFHLVPPVPWVEYSSLAAGKPRCEFLRRLRAPGRRAKPPGPAEVGFGAENTPRRSKQKMSKQTFSRSPNSALLPNLFWGRFPY